MNMRCNLINESAPPPRSGLLSHWAGGNPPWVPTNSLPIPPWPFVGPPHGSWDGPKPAEGQALPTPPLVSYRFCDDTELQPSTPTAAAAASTPFPGFMRPPRAISFGSSTNLWDSLSRCTIFSTSPVVLLTSKWRFERFKRRSTHELSLWI